MTLPLLFDDLLRQTEPVDSSRNQAPTTTASTSIRVMQSWKRIINQFQKASDIVFARHSLIFTKPPEPEKEIPVCYKPQQDQIMKQHFLKIRQIPELPTYRVH